MRSAAVGRGAGLGKLILFGEHAVVYGHAAIAASIDLETTVNVEPFEGATHAQCCEHDERLHRALTAVLPTEGWRVRIDSDIPIGRGLGSSAALAVALTRAAADSRDEALDEQTTWQRAMAVEQVFHGTPSGLDHAISAVGGAMLYRRGPPPVRTRVPCARLPLVVLDTGHAGDTAVLVAGVRSRRPAIDAQLDAIGALAERAAHHLEDAAALGPLMTENHELLRQIGVSTPQLDGLVELALAHGASGAKLSGAGGGGVVIALAPNPQSLLDAAASRGITAFATTVGGS